jgi:hypothetical protein
MVWAIKHDVDALSWSIRLTVRTRPTASYEDNDSRASSFEP